MISLVELAVRVGGLKVNGLPATNFEHHFVVNIGKEWTCSIRAMQWGAWPPSRGQAAIACASSMMQPLSSENAWWSTLAQEHRLKVFRTLVQAGPSRIPTGAIATGG